MDRVMGLLHRRVRRAASLVLVAGLAAACGGPDQNGRDEAPAPGTSGAITPRVLALGDSIFHGLVASGSCQGCHGPDARGTTGVGPDLTDSVWLHSDGSLEGIAATIRSGVMSPKQASSVMLPMGGAPLTPEQVEAVAAYVYELSARSRVAEPRRHNE